MDKKDFEQARIGLCRDEPCGSSSAKDNVRMPKDLRKASRMQSRNPGANGDTGIHREIFVFYK
jgi:hypothetical protein